MLADKCIHPMHTKSGSGHVEVVKLLLADKRVDPSAHAASKNGHIEVVRLMLTDHPVDPSATDTDALRSTSAQGSTSSANIIELLMTDRRVDRQGGVSERIC
jgi:hypothetical protein